MVYLSPHLNKAWNIIKYQRKNTNTHEHVMVKTIFHRMIDYIHFL